MLERVSPALMNKEDFELLYAADAAGPPFNSLEMHQVVRDIWTGKMQLFRLDGGIILTEILEGKTGRRLNIVRMAGENLALQFQQISRALQHTARDLGCNAIETSVYSEKLAKALRRGGAKLESVTMVLELSDG